jgi:hypothetical protein
MGKTEAWIDLFYLRQSSELVVAQLMVAINKARMAERLRRATQVRMEQSSWVRVPLLAFVNTLVHKGQSSPVTSKTSAVWVSAHQKTHKTVLAQAER